MGVKFTADNLKNLQYSKLIILAVKPRIIPFVLDELQPHITDDHVVLSFAAGVNIASIEKVTKILRNKFFFDKGLKTMTSKKIEFIL